jgi:hypothetical protein
MQLSQRLLQIPKRHQVRHAVLSPVHATKMWRPLEQTKALRKQTVRSPQTTQTKQVNTKRAQTKPLTTQTTQTKLSSAWSALCKQLSSARLAAVMTIGCTEARSLPTSHGVCT